MEVLNNKKCKRCEEDKPFTEYYTQQKKKASGEEYVYYNPRCKSCVNELSTEYRKEHHVEFMEYKKEWVKNNPEKHQGYIDKFHSEKKNQYKIQQKDWRQNNKDVMSEHARRYREEKQFKISNKEWERCKDYFNYTCAYCGISENEAQKLYDKGLHKEHAMNKGSNDLSNCLPSCTRCNSSKYTEDYTYWYTEDNSIYNDERLKLISDWLNGDFKKIKTY